MSFLGELVYGEGSGWTTIKNALGWESDRMRTLRAVDSAFEQNSADAACNSHIQGDTVVTELLGSLRASSETVQAALIRHRDTLEHYQYADPPEERFCYKFGNLHAVLDALGTRASREGVLFVTGERARAFYDQVVAEYHAFLAKHPPHERTMRALRDYLSGQPEPLPKSNTNPFLYSGGGRLGMSVVGADQPPKRIKPTPVAPPQRRQEAPRDELLERLENVAKHSRKARKQRLVTDQDVLAACKGGVDFEVRDSGSNRGLGLFALVNIPKGRVITRYGGDVTSEPPKTRTHTLRRLHALNEPVEYIDALAVRKKWLEGKHAEAYEDGVGGLCNSAGRPGEGDAEASCEFGWTESRVPYIVAKRDIVAEEELLLVYALQAEDVE